MSTGAMEGGTPLPSLVAMAVPLCRAAQRQASRSGPGAPPAYAEWQTAVLIMIAVMARRKSKSAQYRYLSERRDWLERRLGLATFPSRSTYFARYRQAHGLFERSIVLQGCQAIAERLTDSRVVAVDKNLIAARGPVWDPGARRKGRCPRGVDREAGFSHSEHHGQVYGYSYEVVVSANSRGVVFRLIASAGPANVSEH